MDKWVFLSFALLLLCIGFIYPFIAKKYSYLLILNSKNSFEVPRNFRTTTFNSSGSGQFSEMELQRMLTKIPSSHIVIVDLRQEPHGFLNGNAVSWYHNHNWGNTQMDASQVLHQEHTFIGKLHRNFFAFVHHDRLYPVPYMVKTARTEKDVVELQRLQYHRFPITDHHRPKDRHVDAFIKWVSQTPKDTWIHFHCSAGKGRTTTFLAMHDMMLNAAKDTVETIVKRQDSLGKLNLFKVSKDTEDLWKKDHIEKRVRFIRQFYKYCKEVPSFDISWSEWIEKKGINTYNL